MTDHKKPTNSGMTAERLENLDNKSVEVEDKIWSLIGKVNSYEEQTILLVAITNILGSLLSSLWKANKNLDPFNWLELLKYRIKEKEEEKNL